MGHNKLCPDGEEEKKQMDRSAYRGQRLNEWLAGFTFYIHYLQILD